MVRHVDTPNAARPFSRYSQGAATEAGESLLFVSGQVGVDANGDLAPTTEGQHEAAWRNILAILAAEGLGAGQLVDVTAYVTDAESLSFYRATRDRMLAGAMPASTLIVVAGLADPRWKVEISAVAAVPAS